MLYLLRADESTDPEPAGAWRLGSCVCRPANHSACAAPQAGEPHLVQILTVLKTAEDGSALFACHGMRVRDTSILFGGRMVQLRDRC